MQIVSTVKTSMKKFAIGVALSATLSMPAFALDSDAFVARLQEQAKTSGLTLSNESAKVDGNTVTLEGVKVSVLGGGEKPFELSAVTFEGVDEKSDGSYFIEKVTPADIDVNDEEDNVKKHLTIQGMQLSKVLLPAKDKSIDYAKELPYENITIKKIVLDEDGQNTVTVDNVHYGYQDFAAGKPIKFTGGVDSALVNVEKMSDPQARQQLSELGYKTLNTGMTIEGIWDHVSGDMDFSKFAITTKEVGTFDISFSLNGLTGEFTKELQKLGERAQKSPEDEKKAGIAMLGMMQQINVKGIKIRFDDDSIANRLLDNAAKQNNASRADVVTQIKALLPILATQLKSPAFGQKAATEVGTFLDNPKSLELTSKPGSPVPFAIIAATAAMEPQKLIEVLNIDIKANQ